ncbi:dihydroorotate dehydrogenase B (NAD(+)), catalytic subunit [Desulfuromonas versatilis]|uniref:Dihydroorotate dehydrogenase n=1 Tax=Desulfuromonas versatilis TaxID=2802975 RepID=A0ABN6E116_9BACT|nr:dihydroorotate dehydrogenase [Desulfuromonas versatilis]BCR05164.1 dihydroorotate dehydrogenase B (NAD(+)), catalytic subunit [Desulfuromonas versatilis]
MSSETTKASQSVTGPRLAVNIAGIEMKNPVMPASGTFGYGEEYAPFLDLENIGAIVTKGLSLKPKAGNPTPRIAETISGMLNAIGLQNVGVDAFIKYKLPFLREVTTPVIVNFFGNTLEEYGEVAKRLSDIPEVAGVELNISCPNVKKGGIVFGTDPKAAAEVVSLVRKNLAKPLIAKLTPNVTDITVIARAVEESGADAICCINTLTGMSIDIKTRRPRLANRTGGLSGPAIRPIAVRMVHQVAQTVKVPVIGVGGIVRPSDAIEFLIAGATAVQVGTANFVDPGIMPAIVEGIEQYCIEEGIDDINELVGSLQV